MTEHKGFTSPTSIMGQIGRDLSDDGWKPQQQMMWMTVEKERGRHSCGQGEVNKEKERKK